MTTWGKPLLLLPSEMVLYPKKGDPHDDERQGTFDKFSFFVHADEVKALVASVGANPEKAAEVYPRFKLIFEFYQEQPELLDTNLESIFSPLTQILRQKATALFEARDASRSLGSDETTTVNVLRMLHVITTVRGHKEVVRFYPVDVASFEPVLFALIALRRSRAEGAWEAQCQLMLWLSALVLIPFDLRIVDSSFVGGEQDATQQGLVERIMGLCKEFLSSPGTVRNFACLLAARLLTRSGSAAELKEFVQFSKGTVATADKPENLFLVIGTVQTLAQIFKFGARQDLAAAALEVWSIAESVVASQVGQSNLLLRKLAVKLVQRVGLVLLEPRPVRWRYQQRPSFLVDNLKAAGDGHLASRVEDSGKGEELQEPDEKAFEESWDVPEEIEGLIDSLFRGISDKDTMVRWSAAKGLGRICGRLPKALVDEILGTVVQAFSPLETDFGWHGACLTIAELSSRGLLLPESFPSVIPSICQALVYDVSRGSYSVGTHVRDAAAHVCWALARAYEPAVLAPSMQQLAPVLMTVACTDREVKCRRAAAAAFQECAGRLGNVPHGIDVLTLADYFTLSTRTQAYLVVTPSVAAYQFYKQHLIDHLLNVKLRHWDITLRQLTAETLGKLVLVDTEFFSTAAIDALIPRCLDSVLEVRHGSALGLSQVLLALHGAGLSLTADRQDKVRTIVVEIEKARLYRGKGGQIMRCAVSSIIGAVAACGLTKTRKLRLRLLDSVHENMRQPNQEHQAEALKALRPLAREFLMEETDLMLDRMTRRYMSQLHDENVAVRRAHSLALGMLPKMFLSPVVSDVVDSLSSATKVEENPDERDAESRVNAVTGLVDVVCQCFGDKDDLKMGGLEIVRDRVMECLFAAMEDYTTDYRGDVGSWVREVTMAGLRKMLLLLAPVMEERISEPANRVVGLLIRNSVERISRIREYAIKNLKALLEAEPIGRFVHEQGRLLEIASADDAGERFATMKDIPKMVPFLRTEVYQFPLLEGLVTSIGGLDKSLTDVTSVALVRHVVDMEKCDDVAALQNFVSVFFNVWRYHKRSSRMSLSLLRTADLLLKSTCLGTLHDAGDAFQVDVLELTKSEGRKCRDFTRLLAVGNVLSHLAPSELAPVRESAWKGLMVLLGSAYPRIRKGTAETIYERLLFENEDELVGKVMETLLETSWDGDMDGVQAAREKLCGLLKLPPPARKKDGRKARGSGTDAQVDENASYQALVDDFVRLV